MWFVQNMSMYFVNFEITAVLVPIYIYIYIYKHILQYVSRNAYNTNQNFNANRLRYSKFQNLRDYLRIIIVLYLFIFIFRCIKLFYRRSPHVDLNENSRCEYPASVLTKMWTRMNKKKKGNPKRKTNEKTKFNGESRKRRR